MRSAAAPQQACSCSSQPSTSSRGGTVVPGVLSRRAFSVPHHQRASTSSAYSHGLLLSSACCPQRPVPCVGGSIAPSQGLTPDSHTRQQVVCQAAETTAEPVSERADAQAQGPGPYPPAAGKYTYASQLFALPRISTLLVRVMHTYMQQRVRMYGMAGPTLTGHQLSPPGSALAHMIASKHSFAHTASQEPRVVRRLCR